MDEKCVSLAAILKKNIRLSLQIMRLTQSENPPVLSPPEQKNRKADIYPARKHFPHLHGLFAVMLRQVWPYVPLRVSGGQSFLALRQKSSRTHGKCFRARVYINRINH